MLLKFLYPRVAIGPNARIDFVQEINAALIARALTRDNATVEFSRKLILNGEVVREQVDSATLTDGVWDRREPFRFECKADQRFDWRDPGNVPFVELGITVVDEKAGFKAPDSSGFYSNYMGDGQKSFLNDNRIKYGDRNVINFVSSKGFLLDSFIAVNIDLDKDATESVFLINPYLSKNVFVVELDGLRARKSVKVPAMSIYRQDLSELLPEGMRRWHGSVFVTSQARPLMMICKHMASDPNRATTIEHGVPYYTQTGRIPWTRHLRLEFGRRVIYRLRQQRLKRLQARSASTGIPTA